MLSDTRSAQERVAASVAARGYRDGWTAEQFAARQVCKLTEELAELALSFNVGGEPRIDRGWYYDLLDAGGQAKWIFERR